MYDTLLMKYLTLNAFRTQAFQFISKKVRKGSHRSLCSDPFYPALQPTTRATVNNWGVQDYFLIVLQSVKKSAYRVCYSNKH